MSNNFIPKAGDLVIIEPGKSGYINRVIYNINRHEYEVVMYADWSKRTMLLKETHQWDAVVGGWVRNSLFDRAGDLEEIAEVNVFDTLKRPGSAVEQGERLHKQMEHMLSGNVKVSQPSYYDFSSAQVTINGKKFEGIADFKFSLDVGTPAEREAQRLISEGYYSTSNKYHHLAKFDMVIPSPDEVINPKLRGTPMHRHFLKVWKQFGVTTGELRMGVSSELPVKTITVSPEVFQAFKKLGGRPA